MKRFKLTFFFTMLLLAGFQHSSLAYDHSITLGPSGLQIVNLEYEKSVSDNTTLNVDYGLSIMGIAALSNEPSWPSYGLGVNHYFNNSTFAGTYVGLHVTHVEAKGNVGWFELVDNLLGGSSDFQEKCTPFEYYTAALGYKKAFNSGFTFDCAVHAIYTKEIGWAASGKIMFGHTW